MDLETKIQTYITDTYLNKAVTGLSTITAAKKTLYDDLVIEETALKATADAKGMDQAAVLAAYSSKSMATLLSEQTVAQGAHTTARVVWEAAVTE